ncbi:Ankyrin repeat-containing domain protein [Naviculisporaceae sp. PSN 640]
MASFRSLPPELLLEIAGWIDERYTLSAFARVNRTCHAHLMQPLFTRYGGEAVRWACQNGNLDILKAATFYARNKKRELLNANYVYDDPFDDDSEDEEAIQPSVVYGQRHGAPLHLACAAGHIDVVNYLLDNGADLHAASSRMCACLYMDDALGIYYGDDDIIDVPKWLPLHHAMCRNHPEIAILLLERNAPLYVSASSASKGRYSVTALQSAAENGLVSVVRYLKEYFQKQKAVLDDSHGSADTDELDFWGQSADPTDPRSADLYGNTAMHYVSLCFDFEAASAIVKDLQELGLDVDERGGRRDATPLLMACCMGNFSAARAFLRAEAFPEAVLEEDFVEYDGLEGDTTCLDNALYARFTTRAEKKQTLEQWKGERYQFIKELIQMGVDVEELPGTSGATPLGIAAQRGLDDEVKLLLEFGGAYVNGMAESGKTALMAAAQRHEASTVKILLEAGACVNQITGFGVTAVDFACSSVMGYAHISRHSDTEQILKLLLEYGARVGIPVEDALTTTMCRSHPCIHDSFLLKLVRRATLDDEEIDDRMSTAQGLLIALLKHATEANITRDCWQAAIMEAFSPLKSEPANPVVCKQLGAFGAKLGYVFDDSTLANIIVKLIVADEPADIGPLFMLGDGEVVRTVTGVLTKTALLTLILVRHQCEDGSGDGSNLVGPLLQSVKNAKGTIKLLKNKGTLLHLAASSKNSEHVKTLLDKGCDLNAITLHGMTPLAEAVHWGDIKAVKLLLDRGADPYLSNAGMPSPRLPDTSEDVLALPQGQRLARAFVELLAKFDCVQSEYLDEPSPFQIAVRKGRNAILEEFIRRKKVLPPIPPEAKRSYMTEVCTLNHFQTAHLLLRAGADPNGGEGVESPPIVHLLGCLPPLSAMYRDPDSKRESLLRVLGLIAHLVRAGADVHRVSKMNKMTAVMYLDRMLHGDLMVVTHHFSGQEFPLSKIVGEVLTIKEDPQTGLKVVKCRNRGIDSWVR